mmetsp:Transcript_65471/g.211093  ORF Transcript_65471/g.211093 Transcript_65471/m.211093 type:complete len:337 (+) Transcript_65471:78-1088(+)
MAMLAAQDGGFPSQAGLPAAAVVAGACPLKEGGRDTAPPQLECWGSGAEARWADLVDSGEETDEPSSSSGGSCAASAAQPPSGAAVSTKWADFADSDEEQEETSLKAAAAAAAPASPAAAAVPAAPHSARPWLQRHAASAAAGTWRPSSSAWPMQEGRRPARTTARRAGQRAPAQAWPRRATSGRQRRGEAPRACGAEAWARRRPAGRWGRPDTTTKTQCQFLIGIEEDDDFQVKRKLLGPHGRHMKEIAEHSGAKLRLRGRGSGFLEGPEQQESEDPLMLCISGPDAGSCWEAARAVRELIEGVHEEYRQFCRSAGQSVPDLRIHVHEGPRPGSF